MSKYVYVPEVRVEVDGQILPEWQTSIVVAEYIRFQRATDRYHRAMGEFIYNDTDPLS